MANRLTVGTHNVHEAYLFGSAASDLADEYSDIDVAVVSDSFAGIPLARKEWRC